MFEGGSYQYKALPFGLSLSPRVFTKFVEAALVLLSKGSRRSQLPRRLAHTGPVSSTVVRTQGYGAQSPQSVGASGQLGKEQTLPYAEDLFSQHGVGLGQPHSMSLNRACSVNAELPEVFPAQEGGSTETGSWGIWHPQPLSRHSDCFI